MVTHKPKRDVVDGDSPLVDKYDCRDDSPRVQLADATENLVTIVEDATGDDDKYAITLDTVVEEASKEEDDDAIAHGLEGQPERTAAAAAAVKSCDIEARDAAIKTLKDCCGADEQGVKDVIAKGLQSVDHMFEKLASGVDWCHKTCVEAKVCRPIGDLQLATPAPEAATEAVPQDPKKVATVADKLEAEEAGDDILVWTREDCGVEGRADEDESREGVSAVIENYIKEENDSEANEGHLAPIPESSGVSKKGKPGRFSPFKSTRPRKWGTGRKGAADDASLGSARSNRSGMFRMRRRGKRGNGATDDESLNSARSNRSGMFRIGIPRKSLGFKNKVPVLQATAE